jgi:hypothetical protein
VFTRSQIALDPFRLRVIFRGNLAQDRDALFVTQVASQATAFCGKLSKTGRIGRLLSHNNRLPDPARANIGISTDQRCSGSMWPPRFAALAQSRCCSISSAVRLTSRFSAAEITPSFSSASTELRIRLRCRIERAKSKSMAGPAVRPKTLFRARAPHAAAIRMIVPRPPSALNRRGVANSSGNPPMRSMARRLARSERLSGEHDEQMRTPIGGPARSGFRDSFSHPIDGRDPCPGDPLRDDLVAQAFGPHFLQAAVGRVHGVG